MRVGGFSVSVCVCVCVVNKAFNSLWVGAVLKSVCICFESPVSFSGGEWGEKGGFQGVVGL